MSTMIDPMDTAVAEAERPNYIYGQLEATASFVMFASKKKVQWIEGQDDPRERRTEVNLLVNPIEETGLTNFFTRSVICSNNNEWATIIWPSLRDECKVANLREADRKWVKVETVKTGRTYTNRSGQTVENTTFKFVAMYQTKDECIAAYMNDGNMIRTDPTKGTLNGNGHGAVLEEDNAAMLVDMTPNADNNERQAALAFLPALVKAANGNKEMLKVTFAGMPMISKYFNVDSPEVTRLMAA